MFLRSITIPTGGGNTAIGDFALANNVDGNYNTADGWGALSNNVSGSNNTAFGLNAGQNVTTADDVIAIGASVVGENVSDTCLYRKYFRRNVCLSNRRLRQLTR